MNRSDFDPSGTSRPAPGPVPGVEAVLRLLALVDAVAVPALIGFWITTWPDNGGFFGAVAAAVMVWWAVKRGSRALFAYERYRWMARHVVKLLAFGLVLQGAVWLLR